MQITVETIPVIAPIIQQMYDGLKSQGFQRSTPEGTSNCLYRGPNGLKCAIGHVIPDENYSDNLEMKSINYFSVFAATLFADFYFDQKSYLDDFNKIGTLPTLLSELQSVHDNYQYPEEMQSEFIAICKNYNIPLNE